MPNRERTELVLRLERLREESRAAAARVDTIDEALLAIAGDEAKLTERRQQLANRVGVLERQIADDEMVLAGLTDEQADIRARLSGKRAELGTVLAALQRVGRRPPPALFGEGGPLNTVRIAILLNSVIPSLDGEARRLANDLARSARLAAEERRRWDRLRADLAELEAERARMAATAEELERRRALTRYERQSAQSDALRLAEEVTSVEALLARLADGDAAPPPTAGLAFAERRGRLPLPVAGEVVGEYGDPTLEGDLARGRVIAALPDATVFAPAPGTVLYAAPFSQYGHVLILDAGDGYHMVLTGLAQVAVVAGDSVAAGAIVGAMGRPARRSAVATIGNLSRPAEPSPERAVRPSLLDSRPLLYVELRKDGAAIDSYSWWRERGAQAGRTSG